MHNNKSMPKQKPQDENEIAANIISQITKAAEANPTKNPAAVMLGKMGGLKGGPARAAKLSSKLRREIAKKAADARWFNK
jgi:hypothetical protein